MASEEKKAYQRRYYQEHKAEINAKNRRYYQRNKEKVISSVHKYRQENKTEINEKKRKLYQENKEEIKEKVHVYYQEHKDEIIKQKMEYEAKNKDRILERRRARKAAKKAQKLAEMAEMGITVDYRYTKEKHPFCSESVSQIEGYTEMMANPTKRYVIHHRRETHTVEGLPLGYNCHLSASMLKTQGLYYKRPASELIWMSSSEHGRLHQTKNNL